MKTYNRRSRAPRVQAVQAEVQELEPKQLLTGTVTVSVNADDDITMLGDTASNDVLVRTNLAGQISVTGRNGTSIKFGNTTTPAGTAVNLGVASLRDFTASFGDGNDILETRLRAVATLNARTVSINMGAGADTLILDDNNSNVGPGGLNLSGNMLVWTEGGNDFVRLDIYKHLAVAGSMGINTGAGNDRISIYDQTKFNINSNTTAGARNELLAVPNDTGAAGNQRIRVGLDINLFPEIGADSVLMLGVESGRDILVDMNDSGGDVFLANNVRSGRNFGIANADLHALNNIWVVGFFGIQSGAGDDKVALSNMNVGQNMDITLGGGDDRIAIGQNVQVSGWVLVDGGAGYDYVSSQSNFAVVNYNNFEAGGANYLGILDSVIGVLLNRGMLN